MNTENMTMVYSAVAVLSVLLLIEKKKELNFIFLISCVAIVNTGYFLLTAVNSLRAEYLLRLFRNSRSIIPK